MTTTLNLGSIQAVLELLDKIRDDPNTDPETRALLERRLPRAGKEQA